MEDFHSHMMQQVTRGHSIVADGWAGVSKPHPHPKPYSIHKHIKRIQNAHFSTFRLNQHGLTDGPTDRQIDKVSYRIACPQLSKGTI